MEVKYIIDGNMFSRYPVILVRNLCISGELMNISLKLRCYFSGGMNQNNSQHFRLFCKTPQEERCTHQDKRIIREKGPRSISRSKQSRNNKINSLDIEFEFTERHQNVIRRPGRNALIEVQRKPFAHEKSLNSWVGLLLMREIIISTLGELNKTNAVATEMIMHLFITHTSPQGRNEIIISRRATSVC